MIAYQIYRRVPHQEDHLIAVLPERRNNAERITHRSIMNWARLFVPEAVLGDRRMVYFVRVEIQ